MAPCSTEPAYIAVVLNVVRRRALYRLVDDVTESMRHQLVLRKPLEENQQGTKISSRPVQDGQAGVQEYESKGDERVPSPSRDQAPSVPLRMLRREALAHFDKWRNGVLDDLRKIVELKDDDKIIEARTKRLDEVPREQASSKDLDFSDDNDGKPSGHEDATTALQDLKSLYHPTPSKLTMIPSRDREDVLSSVILMLLATGHYSAYSRTLILYLASSLNLSTSFIDAEETEIAKTLLEATAEAEKAKENGMSAEAEAQKRQDANKTSRYWKVGLASVAGAAIIGVTGGLAAPLVAGALGGLMGSVGLGGLASFLGVFWMNGALVGTLFGAFGARMTGEMMDKYAREVQDFKFLPLYGEDHDGEEDAKDVKDLTKTEKATRRLRVTIGVNGWLKSPDAVTTPWKVLPQTTEVFALRYELEALLKLGDALNSLIRSAAWKTVRSEIIKRTALAALWAAMWPLKLLSVASMVDNPFNLAKNRSDKAGKILADALINKVQGERPVTLIGYSLGARVIFKCLQTLAERKAFGLVDTVVLIGAPVPADREDWQTVSSVVSSKVSNVYSENDYVLAFLYRATSIQLGVAGLQAIDDIEGVVNLDLSNKVNGHLRYPEILGQILSMCGISDVKVETHHIEAEHENDLDVDADAVELKEADLQRLVITEPDPVEIKAGKSRRNISFDSGVSQPEKQPSISRKGVSDPQQSLPDAALSTRDAAGQKVGIIEMQETDKVSRP